MKFPVKQLRRLVEGFMNLTTCTITRPSSAARTWSAVTGTYSTTPARVTLYDGPCLISSVNVQPHRTEQGGQVSDEVDYWLSLPAAVDTVFISGDLVTVTAVDEEDGDPSLLGETFTLDVDTVGSIAVSRRIRMRRVTEVPE